VEGRGGEGRRGEGRGGIRDSVNCSVESSATRQHKGKQGLPGWPHLCKAALHAVVRWQRLLHSHRRQSKGPLYGRRWRQCKSVRYLHTTALNINLISRISPSLALRNCRVGLGDKQGSLLPNLRRCGLTWATMLVVPTLTSWRDAKTGGGNCMTSWYTCHSFNTSRGGRTTRHSHLTSP